MDNLKSLKHCPNYSTIIKWYQEYDMVKQVDNIDRIYDLQLLKLMYNYLNKNGYLFYIK